MSKIFFAIIFYFSFAYPFFHSAWLGDRVDCFYVHEKEINEIKELYKKNLETLGALKWDFLKPYAIPDSKPSVVIGRDWHIIRWYSPCTDGSYGSFVKEYFCTGKGWTTERYDNSDIDTFLLIIDQMKQDFNLLLYQYISLAEKDYEQLKKTGPHWSRMGNFGTRDTYLESCLTRLNRLKRDIEPYSEKNKNFDHLKELLRNLLFDCADNCNDVHALWNKGLFFFREGNSMGSLEIIRYMVDNFEYNDFTSEYELSELYQNKGQISQELGLYQEAVKALSEAIKLDPENKEAYFDRATSYFEMGEFEKSIQDYLESGFNSTKIDPEDFSSLDFAAGLIKSTAFSATESVEDFIPSIFSSISGLTNGLWAFANDPKECSIEMVESCKAIASLISDNSAYENLRLLFPEIGELAKKWDTSSSYVKGELMGKI